MCTALIFKTKDSYFGRNLDLEYHYQERIAIMPRNMPLQMRFLPTLEAHYAMIGMATIDKQFPLFYEATNEYGLSMAGLNFPGNGTYQPYDEGRMNVTPFEFIPWLLGQSQSVAQAKQLLQTVNLVKQPYSENYPLTPLHWLLSDSSESVTIEPTDSKLNIYANPVGILTNNPPFPYHLENLNNYMQVSACQPENKMSKQLHFRAYSNGMGGLGLPGDFSSASRFIKTVFTKFNSVCAMDEMASVTQFFHILDAVAMPSGAVKIGNQYEKTIYSSCCNTRTCTYYYTTYENRQITAISMQAADIDTRELLSFSLNNHPQIQKEL